MAKIYSKKPFSAPKMEAKKETVSFLLNYSKAFSFLKVGKLTFENIAN